MIKVMKNAQKIIRRDPDLMTVMQININDSDITPSKDTKKKKIKKNLKNQQLLLKEKRILEIYSVKVILVLYNI